ncbi:MAG: methylenetetrahydrofolate reductase (NADPH) [Candidatus Deianiraeaceae bacterium]|jgi:methylenetetrahydrofolate reductase (NADPH)
MPLKLSVEFFPPAENLLTDTVKVIEQYVKNFPIERISITHGAAGSQKDKSLHFIEEILKRQIIAPEKITAHLSCAGLAKSEVMNYIAQFHSLGLRETLVIKGDPTASESDDSYKTTSDAIIDIKKQFTDISIVAACFPEPRNGVDEMTVLKEKVQSGTDRFISQFCFDCKYFEEFYKHTQEYNMKKEITIGLIVPSVQTLNFARKCYANIPQFVEEISHNEEDSIQFVVDQMHKVESIGYSSVHLYSLNKLSFVKVLNKYFDERKNS